MCNRAVLDFVRAALTVEEIANKRILEVGSLDVNGSARNVLMQFNPRLYIGVDIQSGPGVDIICNACDLISTLPEMDWDVVVSTEMLEHVDDWRCAITNMKRMLYAGGSLLLTTRSRGFPYHEYPIDAWRFEVEDMRKIFADFNIITCIPDPIEPGVFIKARRPYNWIELDLNTINIKRIIPGEPY